MGKFFDEIPQFLIEWIVKQKMFWVASAPLSSTGFVNVSPKGVEGSFHLVSPTQVWFEDLTGSGTFRICSFLPPQVVQLPQILTPYVWSGVETIAHLRENGRITVLFSAFEGPPRIVRIFGKGTLVHRRLWGGIFRFTTRQVMYTNLGPQSTRSSCRLQSAN